MTAHDDSHDETSRNPLPADSDLSPAAPNPANHSNGHQSGRVHPAAIRVTPPGYVDPATAGRQRQTARQKSRRRQLRTSVILFVLTFLSTTLVGSNFLQVFLIPALFDPDYAAQILPLTGFPNPPAWADSAATWLLAVTLRGLTYSVPLMVILLCHEMGHFLQAVRYRVPASFPYFIPLPIPPLGTMGAVILQGRGVANRKQMFDIAITGPLAGLVVTLPVLYYGISQAQIVTIPENGGGMQFGNPLLVQWMVAAILEPLTPNTDVLLNGYLFAGWVGVFITALNLLPVGQLDGGHIMYTLIGRKAHWIAMGVIGLGVAAMVYTGKISYVLLLVLLMLTGPRHPPTADDSVPLGPGRVALGWLTLAFLIIGFTPQPIIVSEEPAPRPAQQQFDPERRKDPGQVDPNRVVRDSICHPGLC